MTELKGVLKRSVKVYGIEGMTNVSLSEEGLKFAIPGTKQHVMTSWSTILQHCDTPTNVPAHLFGRPKELLQHAVQKLIKRRAEKLEGE